MESQIKIFVGSSSSEQSLPVAKAVQKNLADEFDVKVWTTEFPPGEYFLEALLKTLEWADFGVFVFSANDAAQIQDPSASSGGDNVLFEAGLYMGRFGKERTFIVRPDVNSRPLASDLAGIMTGTYKSHLIPTDPQSAVGDFCTRIAALMRLRGMRPRMANLARLADAVSAKKDDADLVLHTFMGQDPKPAIYSDGPMSFTLPSVFRLWAEPGSRVQTFLRDEGGLKLLRIEFENLGHYPGDVTIRPMGFRALAGGGRQFLTIDVRAPLSDPENVMRAETDRHLALGIRAIDAQATQWSYGRRDMRADFAIPIDGAWHCKAVDLKDASQWEIFPSDGNYYYASKAPDFSILSAVVFEVGLKSDMRPGHGRGTIEIKRVCLVNSLPPNAQLT